LNFFFDLSHFLGGNYDAKVVRLLEAKMADIEMAEMQDEVIEERIEILPAPNILPNIPSQHRKGWENIFRTLAEINEEDETPIPLEIDLAQLKEYVENLDQKGVRKTKVYIF
jgi:hypothetical protein